MHKKRNEEAGKRGSSLSLTEEVLVTDVLSTHRDKTVPFLTPTPITDRVHVVTWAAGKWRWPAMGNLANTLFCR